MNWRHRLVIALVALGAYAPTLRVSFMLDDPWLIQQNPYIREWRWDHVKHDFSSNVQNDPQGFYYRPALTLLLRTQYTLWGTRPFGYHLTSLLFHLLSALLLAELVVLLGLSSLTAMILSLLFAAHPLIVDDLLAASGGDMMANFFLLASVLFICQPSKTGYGAGLLFYVLALFSKESAVIIPFLCALIFWYQERPRTFYRRLLPMAALWIPYVLMRREAVSLPPSVTAPLTVKFIFMAFPRILLHYVRIIFLPWNLQTWPPILRLSHAWPFYALIFIGLPVGLWMKRWRLALFGWGWFLLHMAPRIPVLMNNGVMMDKWAALASIGLLLPISEGLALAWRDQHPGVRYGTRCFWGSWVVLLAVLTHLNVTWRGSDEKNYRWTLRFGSPDFAVYRLGIILMRTGRAAESLPYFTTLSQAHPENPDYRNTLSLALWHTGKRDAALRTLRELVKERPGYPPALENLEWMLESVRQVSTNPSKREPT